MHNPMGHWKGRAQAELALAQIARESGNEGKARVCARRAAGVIAAEYLRQKGVETRGLSAYSVLRALASRPELTSQVQVVVSHFLVKVNPEFNLPLQADLVVESRWLSRELLGEDL